MSEIILHITSREAWNAAQKAGQYTAPSLTSDGFIHCSTRAQVLPVAEKFYKGQTGLVILVIDSDASLLQLEMGGAVRWRAASARSFGERNVPAYLWADQSGCRCSSP